MVARRQVHRVRLGSIRAATKSGSPIRKARAPKKITDLDNEKGALVWTPDSKPLLYTAADKKLYSYTVADGKTAVDHVERRRRASDRSSVSPDSKWVAFSKQDRTLRSHVYIAPIAGGEERHISDDSLLYSENNAVWTADGRYIVFTSAEGCEQRHRHAGRHRHDDGAVGAVAARSGSRSDEPRHRQRSAGARGRSGGAAERRPWRRAARRRSGGHASTGAACARRARRLTVPGTTIGGLTPAPEGHSVALTVSTGGAGGGRGAGAAADPTAGMYIINVESGQLTRVPPAPPNAGAAAAGAARRRRRRFGGGSSMVFARDGRTLYFRSGSGLFAAPLTCRRARAAAQDAGGGRRRRGGRGGARRRRPTTPRAGDAGARRRAR